MVTIIMYSICHRRSEALRWKTCLLILSFCVYSSLDLRWLDSCFAVAGPAFIQPSRSSTAKRLSLAASPTGRSKKPSQNTSKNSQNHSRKPQTNKNDPKAIDMNNLLSNMGLQQVNATTAKRNSPAKSTQKVKPQNNAKRNSTLKFPEISLRTQLDYARNGHGVLRNFITDGEESQNNKRLMNLRKAIVELARDEELKAWVQKVEVAAGKRKNDKDIVDACRSIEGCQKALQDMGVTASLPFLQYFNTWRKIPAVKDLAIELGEAASILLDVPTVRLYQDAVFWKRSQDGPTPWHADARMAPFDTQHMITFWIPLQGVPSPRDGGTALIFCSKSHSDFALPYWNPPEEIASGSKDKKYASAWDRLEDRYPEEVIDYMPMSLGDVTIHSGWTLHCSNGNEIEGSKDRIALAISFVDGDAEIRHNWQSIGDDEDRWSYQDWCKEVRPQRKFSHELVPIIWPPSRRDTAKEKKYSS